MGKKSKNPRKIQNRNGVDQHQGPGGGAGCASSSAWGAHTMENGFCGGGNKQRGVVVVLDGVVFRSLPHTLDEKRVFKGRFLNDAKRSPSRDNYSDDPFFKAFHGYCGCLVWKGDGHDPPREEITKEDYRVVKSFCDAESLPARIRSFAAWTLAILYRDVKENLERAADYYRQAMHICDTAVSEEGKKDEPLVSPRRRQRQRRQPSATMVDLMQIRAGAASDLAEIRNSAWAVCSSTDPIRQQEFLTPRIESLRQRLNPGGDRCDYCHKTREELGMPVLDVCSRCELANYCSKECSIAAWKAGHNKACRKKSQIVPGDLMTLQKWHPDPSLNGRLVEVLERDDDHDNGNENDQHDNEEDGSKSWGRWKVVLFGQPENRLTVYAKNHLVHIRPEV